MYYCSYKTGSQILNKLNVDNSLVKVFSKNVDRDMLILLTARALRIENQDTIDSSIVGTWNLG